MEWEQKALQACIILSSKNPYLPSSPGYHEFSHYIITWLIGNRHHYGELKKGRALTPYEGNSTTAYVAYLLGISHGECLDIISNLKERKLL